MSNLKAHHNILKGRILEAILLFETTTDERVGGISVEKNIDDEYVVTPLLGEPSYTDEAIEILEE